MSERIQIIDPCTSAEWTRFVRTHHDAGIFHQPAWLTMLRDVYGFRILAVCALEGEKIRGAIPFADVRSFVTGRRWVSLPFSDHCQPLLPSDAPDTTRDLMEFISRQLGTSTPKIEIRWGVDASRQAFREPSFVIHTLDLAGKDEESIFKSFEKQGAQRSVKIAEKEGVTVKACSTFEEFEVFFRLQVKTRRRLGVPAQPKRFFKGVWDYVIQREMGFVLVAFKGATPIAGGVFFRSNKTMYYKYSASDITYKALQPNSAFLWEAIRRALEEKCTKFDFGRSEKENEGLRRFKRSWGSTERELAYTVFADRPPRVGSSRLDALVGPVIRHSPEFVCTLSGELLYKHMA